MKSTILLFVKEEATEGGFGGSNAFTFLRWAITNT
jgi:hypothetical protein